MSTYTFIKNYKENDKYRASFNDLAKLTFQIDFEPWFQQRFWNDSYICYSYLDGDKVIANVSISKLEMVIHGETKHAIQIGTVMTHPDYQKQGLAGSLMKRIISEYEGEYDLFFLFSDESVTTFYKKYGFTPVQETKYTLSVTPMSTNIQPRKLNLQSDKDMILNYYTKKKPSHRFDIEKAESILGFYGVYVFANNIYYIEELDAVVIYKYSDEKLHLYGVFAEQSVSFTELFRQIASEKTTEVVFHFTPNFDDVNPMMTALLTTDDIFQIRTSRVSLPTNFKFPLIAHA
jgi:GNAT superfamily N-acetyltransferase